MPDLLSVSVKLFADDCIIYHEVNSPDDALLLQSNLNRVFEWSTKWSLPLKISKTNHLPVHHKSHPFISNYSLNSLPINTVSSCKYLGLTFTTNMNWNLHVSNVIKTAKFKLFYLRRRLKYSTPNIRLLCYKSFILPLLLYGSEIWDPFTLSNIMALESIQNKAARFISNNWSRTHSISSIKDSLSLKPLSVIRKIHRLTLLFKFHHQLSNFLPDSLLVPAPYFSSRVNHQDKLSPIFANSNPFKYSFFPRTINEWNSLNSDIISTPNITSFKNALLNI